MHKSPKRVHTAPRHKKTTPLTKKATTVQRKRKMTTYNAFKTPVPGGVDPINGQNTKQETPKPLPTFSTTPIDITISSNLNSKLKIHSAEQAQMLKKMFKEGNAPVDMLSVDEQKPFVMTDNPAFKRRGYNYALANEEHSSPRRGLHAELPATNVMVLPASSKIARKYVDDIRSGKVVDRMYREFTKSENLQEVYTPSHTYVHWFRIHERNQRDFLKRLGLIETKLNQRFGSTYYLHVSKTIRKFRKRFTVLRSPFVHKKAQDTYEYNHNEYICKISYAFAITDPEINDFIYNQLKSQVIAAGAGISFGWDVKHQKPKVRPQVYTPLSSNILNLTGTNPDIHQIKYANYVGQQELLRQHCEANGLDYEKYGGDSNLFPLRDDMLRFRDRKLKLINAGYTPSEAEKQAYHETDISELSDPTYSEPSEEALGILKM